MGAGPGGYLEGKSVGVGPRGYLWLVGGDRFFGVEMDTVDYTVYTL